LYIARFPLILIREIRETQRLYLPVLIKYADADCEKAGASMEIGDMQKCIMQVVSKYRELAKMRMVGDPEGQPVPGDELGLTDDRIEFDDLQILIDREKRKASLRQVTKESATW
jgi:hypothetical protein